MNTTIEQPAKVTNIKNAKKSALATTSEQLAIALQGGPAKTGDGAPPAPPSAPPAPPPAEAPVETLVLDPLLLQILSTKRKHESQGDLNFRIWLHAHIKSLGFTTKVMGPGNIVVVTDEKSDTLFSAHVDTCHAMEESNVPEKQELFFDAGFNHLFLSDTAKKTSRCLGADDGSGIFILLKLIEAKVPGSYIFHVGEECGGVGAYAMMRDHRPWAENFSRAIAFDRAGDHEVIITQGGRACASLEFGNALAKALNDANPALPKYENSHKGTFTDTKVYADIVEECVNVGVGYYNQHGQSEYQDVEHLYALLKACLKVEWDKLPTKRKAEPEPAYKGYDRGGYGGSASYGKGSYIKDDKPAGQQRKLPLPAADGYDDEAFAGLPRGQRAVGKAANAPVVPKMTVLDEMEDFGPEEMSDLVDSEPEVAASALWILFAKYKALTLENEILNRALGM